MPNIYRILLNNIQRILSKDVLNIHRNLGEAGKILIIHLLLLTGISSSLFGQLEYQMPDHGLDSLKGLLKNSTITDSVRVQALADISVYYRVLNFDSAEYYANIAIQQARKNNFWLKEINMLHNLSRISYFKGNFKEAYAFNFNAQELAKKNNNQKGVAISLTYFGDIYLDIGNYSSALHYYLEALKNNEKAGDIEGKGISHNSLGITYSRLKNWPKTEYHYKKALGFANKLNSSNGVLACLNNLGEVFIESKKLDTAKVYLERALLISKKQSHRMAEGAILANLARIEMEEMRPEKSLLYASEGIKIHKEINDKTGLMLDYLFLGELFYSTRKYVMAIKENEKGLRIAIEQNRLESIVSAYRQLSKCFEEMEEYAKALDASKEYIHWSDSLLSFEKFSKINQLEASFAIEKEKAKIERLEKEKILNAEILNQQIWKFKYLILSACLLTAIAILLYIRFRQKSNWLALLKKKNETIEKQNDDMREQNTLIESVNKDLRGKALRAQMNPHFIFNALNSIQYLIANHNSEEAFKYLSKFSVLLRKVLENVDETTIPIAEELEMLQLYIELEALRFDDNFQYKIELSEQAKKSSIPPMIIQPFVENAIVHGLLSKPSDRRLDIKLSMKEAKVICQVTDNGIGRKAAWKIKAQKPNFFNSMGMKLTEKQLEVHNNLNNGNSAYIVDDLTDEEGRPTGTRVTLTFDHVN